MTNLRSIAIDDEPLALKQMCSYIEKTPFLELVADCRDAFEATEKIRQLVPDLLFVDINMPGLSGLELVRSLIQPPIVVFTTAYSQYAIEGFQVDAVDYLLKPISYTDFLKAANKALKMHDLKQPVAETLLGNDEGLFVKSEYRIVRIRFNEIKYIEGMREYVRIHTTEGNPIMTLLSMKALEEKLPQRQFMRVHRSFIVNLNKINVIERNRIVFDSNVYIPVGEQYKEDFQQYIEKNFL
jgi:two-component system LytT family response regulator